MDEPYIRHLEVLGFEKRFVPNQYYVYMLMVKWSDLSEKLIYRKFSEIYDFHKMLKELFPIEAGEIDSKARTLPHLPAPRWLEGHKATENRQSTLSDYFQSLLNLPPKISRCQWIVNFLQVRPDDVALPFPHATKKTETYLLPKDRARSSSSEITGPMLLQTYRSIAVYQKNSKYEMSIQTGDIVEIVEKNQNGWWFCQLEGRRGWLPAAFLEPLDSPDENEEQEPNYEGEVYKVIHSYKAEQQDELSLSEDELVDVIHKLLDGWWVVRKGEITGYYPSMHLQKSGTALNTGFNMKKGHLPPPRRSTIRNAQSIHVLERKQISQDSYRRNSKRYLQQKGAQGHTIANRNAWKEKQDPRTTATGGTVQEEERRKKIPEIPPRPTLSEILAHCTEQTKSKIK
ncbi:neutrophil cytosol factor 1 isoform X2 [Amblyraja radiata]|uniref:neutrophil cytosol factor 1 isoform X2 n=1 Tax=Amblyraja radiata TaxID=386614 RepID=UPI001401D2DB|nr:neutrophil cytosol factor 1 isoform X2 [Amblyraja radiata]XP_032901446.1 neutrophil cytosol factor 1 isoform X2 [Amblyraja radiata]